MVSATAFLAPVNDVPADGALFVVMSGAYIGQELAAELGPIPPTMMPIGHSPLYQLQFATMPRSASIHLVLPESFELSDEDARHLQSAGVKVIPLPDMLSLGTAIVYAINYIGRSDCAVHILHGDTLIPTLPEGSDIIAVAEGGDEYSWAYVESQDDAVVRIHIEVAAGSGGGRSAACGYFVCSSSVALVRSILLARGDFVLGLDHYAQEHTLRVVHVEQWHDFGHLQTFFQSRRVVSTSRAFNEVRIGREAVRKSSPINGAKIGAEADWFASAPAPLLPFCSRLLSRGQDEHGPFYETEYEYLLTLSELYLFGAIGKGGWGRIIAACGEFLALCASTRGDASGDDALRRLTVDKTVARLEQFARESGFDINRGMRFAGRSMPSLIELAGELEGAIDFRSGRSECVMHGDFCFSNIFYNSRAHRVRVIDPRGYVEPGVSTPFGDLRYDLAKLSHSVIGRYDQILAGRYRLDGSPTTDMTIAFEDTPVRTWLECAFGEIRIEGTNLDDLQVTSAMIGLFLSMLPLHADRPDRQQAFIANALRLYAARF